MRSAEPIYVFDDGRPAGPARMRAGAPPPPVRGHFAGGGSLAFGNGYGNGYETSVLTPRTAAALPPADVVWDSAAPPGSAYPPVGSFAAVPMPGPMGSFSGYPQVGLPMTGRGVSPVPSPLISARSPVVGLR
jgi:hypothetical protein